MAVTWKKVLAEGQVLSGDLATDGSNGHVLTTNGSGTLSYTAKTVNSECGGDGHSRYAITEDSASTVTFGNLTSTADTTLGASASGDVITILGGDADGAVMMKADGQEYIKFDGGGEKLYIGGQDTTIGVVMNGNVLSGTNTGDQTLPTEYSSGGSMSGTLTLSGAGSDLIVGGDLTVSGDTITQNVSSILVEDDEIVLLHNVANDTTDSAITFGMNTASRQSVIGHDASEQRVVVAESIASGTLADIDGFVATVETHATAKPDTGNSGSGIGSFWVEEDSQYLYVRVE